MTSIIDFEAAKLESLVSRPSISSPLRFIEDITLLLDTLTDKFSFGVKSDFQRNESDFLSLVSKIDALSPLKTMSRGYVYAVSNGKTVSSV